MAKNLGNKADLEASKKAAEGRGPSPFLSIPDTKTPWYLLSLEYADSFVHWVETESGRRAVRCGGGVEKEFSPDKCPICAYMLDLYNDAKALRADGDAARADKLKNKANGLRGKYQAVFKAIRGQYALVKNPKTGKKSRVADWDMDDEDSNVAVGLISMSQSQFDGFTGMIGGEDTPFIQSAEDLANRVLYTTKERRKGSSGSKYSAVVWGAEEEESEMPEVEIPKEVAEINLDDYAKIDEEELQQVYQLLTGSTSEEVDDDEEVELEEDSDDSEVDEDYLDDVEGDDEEEERPNSKKARKVEEEPEEFEDDIPYDEDEDDEEEEEEPRPKKKAPVKKSSTARKTSNKRRM